MERYSKWVENWNKFGYEGLKDNKRPGRPTRLNENEKKNLLEKVNDSKNSSRITCKILCIQVQEEFLKNLSDGAIRKFLHKHNLSWKKPKKKDYRQNEELKQEFEEELKKRPKTSLKTQ